jgi:hypothetical protein
MCLIITKSRIQKLTEDICRQTLRADDSEKEEAEISAKFLGFTPDGAPIMKFVDDPGKIESDRGVVVGRGDGHVIVAFRKAMTVVSGGTNGGGNSGPPSVADLPRSSTPGPSTTIITRTTTPPPISPRSPVVRILSPPGQGPNDSPV